MSMEAIPFDLKNGRRIDLSPLTFRDLKQLEKFIRRERIADFLEATKDRIENGRPVIGMADDSRQATMARLIAEPVLLAREFGSIGVAAYIVYRSRLRACPTATPDDIADIEDLFSAQRLILKISGILDDPAAPPPANEPQEWTGSQAADNQGEYGQASI